MLAGWRLRPTPRAASYWVTLALILALALPPALLAGLLDVRIQRALKGLQQRLARCSRRRSSADPETLRTAEA